MGGNDEPSESSSDEPSESNDDEAVDSTPGTDPANAAAAPVVPEGGFDVAPPEEVPEDSRAGTSELVDTSGAAWRLIEVPALDLPSVVSTPEGWFALSRRSLGEGKALLGFETALYRSHDGVRWTSIPLDPGHDDLALRDLVYGDGTYVAVGRRYGNDGHGVFFTSTDGEDWEEARQPDLDSSQLLDVIGYAEGLFFAFGFRVLAVSPDGKDWTLMGSDLVQFGAVAYGNGRYVIAGNGPMMVSESGYAWTSYDVDCAIPGACITDPSGNVGQSAHGHIAFVDGYFYSNQMRSADGIRWEALPDRQPAAYVGGRFLGGYADHLYSWTPDGDIEPLHVIRPSEASVTAEGRDWLNIGKLDRDGPFPDTVNVPFEDDLDCTTASCVIVGYNLYLVPPEGTEPLPDRIPRDAEGAPLLSYECPVSQMLRCDDYDARTGCICDEEAPQNPDYCQDVSDFQCAGAFEHEPGEWDVPDVGAAGCDCNAVDPNEPATFGDDCTENSEVCAAPLVCLEVDAPYSGGPSLPVFMCTAACGSDADCPSWEASGYCAGEVQLACSRGSCQPRECE